MNTFLRGLSPGEQVGLLFVIVFGLLALVSGAALVLSLKDRHEDDLRTQNLQEFNGLLKTSWVMIGVFWIGWTLGDTFATVLFGLVAFFALREFITLSPTRQGDHRSLVLAFFVVLPLQFALVINRHFDLVTVFIPVYVFLAIPVVSALANDPFRFLERTAKLQWGIMVCVYGMSHVPALLLLKFPNYQDKNAFLVFFLVFVVQSCMVVQHLASGRLKRKPSAPHVSKSFNWTSWLIAMVAGSLLVLTTGRQYCERFTGVLPVEILPCPINFPRMMYYQLWHERTHASASAKWLRERVKAVAAALRKQ